MPFFGNPPGAGGDYHILGHGNVTGSGTTGMPLVTGTNNMGVGVGALQDITVGARNVTLGDSSLAALVGGTNNVAIGDAAGATLGDCGDCVIIGRAADAGTPGAAPNGVIIIGSLAECGTADSSIGIGQAVVATALRGIAVGHQAGANDPGLDSIAIGSSCVVGGVNSIAIGPGTGDAGFDNAILIGNSLAATVANSITIGDASQAGHVTIAGIPFPQSIVVPTVTTIAAAGTDQATATPITSTEVNVTTVAAGTGAVLPSGALGTTVGTSIRVTNNGADALTLYPQAGATIDGGAVDNPFTIPVSESVTLTLFATNSWYTTEDTVKAGTGLGVAHIQGGLRITLDATQSLTSLAVTNAPVNPTDVVNLQYFNENVTSKVASSYATAGALPANTYANGSLGVGATITGNAVGILAVDGNNIVLGDLILVKDESGANQPHNGLYQCTTEGTAGVAFVLTRVPSMDQSKEFPGALIYVAGGSANIGTGWICTNAKNPTIGSTNIAFAQFSGVGTFTAAAPISLTGKSFGLAIDSATAKASPIGADELVIADSAAAFASKKTTLNQLTAFIAANLSPPITCDPYWANVVALLHFDGTNGSTTFTDEVGHTFTVEGNAQLSTSNPLYGTACGLFDGNGDDIQCTHSDFALGTGNFTLEFYMRVTTTIGATKGIIGLSTSPGGPGPYLDIQAASNNGLTFRADAASATTRLNVFIPGYYYHIALVQNNGLITLFVNGIKEAATLATPNLTGTLLSIGGDVNISGTTNYFPGNIDEFRLTKGVARYTNNFTPPNAAFLSVAC